MTERVRRTTAMVLALGLGILPALGQSGPSSSSASASSAPAGDVSSPAAPEAPIGTGVPKWIEQKSLDTQAQLKELESSLSLSKDKSDQLKAEIEAMKGDRDKQNAALIAGVARVKAAEADIAAVQNKIGDL